MLQVTVDLQTRLHDLEQRMSRLVKWRTATIREAEALIERTNREFDETAVELGKEINELRERLHVDDEPAVTTKPKTFRSHKAPALDGLDEDEQAHYKRLLARRKNRR